MSEPSRDNHYVPQFYLRQFACADDSKKAAVITRHGPYLVAERKSISQMGYEEDLHAFSAAGAPFNLEEAINKTIETPFSSSPTWKKIAAGDVKSLDASDRRAIYAFNSHLQVRNLEMLRFIETLQAQIREKGFPSDFSEEEREMHEAIARTPGGARAFFLMGATRALGAIDRADEAGVIVGHTKLKLRTSTCPPIPLALPPPYAGRPSDVDGPRAWWLPLTPHCGALVTRGTPFPEFTHTDMEDDAVRVLNRTYLAQLLEGLSVRYCIADDEYLEPDLDWLGFELVRRSEGGFRYTRRDA